MVNILGGGHGALSEDLYAGYPHVLARDPRLKVHLYGKDVKPGRKVGHVTAYGDDLDDVRERARHAAALVPRRPRKGERMTSRESAPTSPDPPGSGS